MGSVRWSFRAFVVVALATAVCIHFISREPSVAVTPPAAKVLVGGPGPADGLMQTVLDKSAGYEARVKALRQLPRNLSIAQQQALRELARIRDEHPTIRNDCLSALEKQSVKLKDLGQDLVAMWNDKAESVTWRDYCLQHFEAVFPFADNRSEIRETLFAVARGQSTSKDNFPGTAMLSLQRLGQKDPSIAAELAEIARAAVLVAPGTQADPEKTVTALQVAREAGDTSVLPEARRLAADEKALTRLRMSAVGTLGTLGGEEDAPLLERLTQDKDKRLQRAARAQLEELRKRHPGKATTESAAAG